MITISDCDLKQLAQRIRSPVWIRDAVGEGFGVGGLADPGPRGRQFDGDTAVAVGEVFLLDGEEREAGEVGVGLGEDVLLGGCAAGRSDAASRE